MITKNEIPILEYDMSSREVIAPDYDWEGGRPQEEGRQVRAVFIYRGFACECQRVRCQEFRDRLAREGTASGVGGFEEV